MIFFGKATQAHPRINSSFPENIEVDYLDAVVPIP